MNLKQAKELVRSRLSDKRYEHTINVKKWPSSWQSTTVPTRSRRRWPPCCTTRPRRSARTRCAPSCRRTRNTPRAGEARPTPVWHGVCASILARTEWGVTDEAVLSAIACHTAGKPGMTQLDKILYLADMTSAERDWPGVEKLRKLELKDLDAPCWRP